MKMYKSAEAKAKVRHIATGGKTNSGPRIVLKKGPLFLAPPKEPPIWKTQGVQLDEYFDALALAATTDQDVLAELVASNSKLTMANSDLVTAVAKLTKANAVLTTKLGQARGGRRGGECTARGCVFAK